MAVTYVQKTIYKVADFVSWQKSHYLVLAPCFQRRPVWKPGAKSYLIDTIVRGLPIPIIFIRDRRTDPNQIEPIREVVDGQQRLRTVLGYISPTLLPDYNPQRDSFIVKKTHNEDLAGKSFDELDEEKKQAILDYEFVVHVLPSRVDDREVIQIFRRMNSTNFSLTEQEKRNAEYFGEFKTSVYNLAAEQLQRWRQWKTFTEDNIARMSEVELTSELVLIMINQKIEGKSAARIKSAYETYDENYAYRARVEECFRTVMESIDKNFGSYSPDFVFYKKTLIYVFFALIYELLFGLQSLSTKSQAKSLTTHQVSQIKLASERIRMRTAPKPVLDACDRRTTNPKERNELFNYLLQLVKEDGQTNK
jgi:uncharacterized protein with ParB-like and HNH nuclease domain